jgi:transketolase
MDGHNIDEIVATLEQAKTLTGQGKPIVILMKTTMGKGVDFMETGHEWHGIAPNDAQLENALGQLEMTLGDYSKFNELYKKREASFPFFIRSQEGIIVRLSYFFKDTSSCFFCWYPTRHNCN